MASFSVSHPNSAAGSSRLTVIGFLLPFALVLLMGFALHSHKRSVTNIPLSSTASSRTSTPTAGDTRQQPSGSEISSADAAILTYCQDDLRQGTNCSLIANSNVAAPGFVESGVRMSGYFEGQNSRTDGLALAAGSGSSWSVIWVGQGCIPQDIANQNNVPSTFNVCPKQM